MEMMEVGGRLRVAAVGGRGGVPLELGGSGRSRPPLITLVHFARAMRSSRISHREGSRQGSGVQADKVLRRTYTEKQWLAVVGPGNAAKLPSVQVEEGEPGSSCCKPTLQARSNSGLRGSTLYEYAERTGSR